MPTATAPRRTRADLARLSLGHLRRVIQAIHSQSVAIEAELGLSGPQLWALREIVGAADEEGLSLGELARRLALHPANAGRLVDRLARRRLVRRQRSSQDRRVILVAATAAGERLAEARLNSPPQQDLLRRLSGLPPAEVARIERTLARLAELMGQDGDPGEPLFERRGR